MRHVRFAVLGLAFVLAPFATLAQDQTLADIRRDLTNLNAEIQSLKRELQASGNSSVNVSGSGVSERMDTIELSLSNLTQRTEALENRIDRIVSDGTNRIGDLEFRLVELEGGDISALGDTPTLGGGELPAGPVTQGTDGGVELAVSEEQDFNRAKEAFDAGDYQLAADRFQAFTDTYQGGPLTGVAHYLRGESLKNLGLESGAARAFLESFSGAPTSDVAPAALLQLGLSLDRLGQRNEACVTLGEVTARFPESPTSVEAQTARAEMSCT